jgi:hypothetical protein
VQQLALGWLEGYNPRSESTGFLHILWLGANTFGIRLALLPS